MSRNISPRILPAGDSAIVLEIGDTISDEINDRIVALTAALDDHPPAGLRDIVPTYRSVLVRYDPQIVRGADLGRQLLELCDRVDRAPAALRRLTVPCVYGGEVGMDLDDLARDRGLARDEVIALHSGADYRVHMIGFAPGFAYLGGLPEALHTPRLAVPRQLIPAGALGIGGRQASINSVAGPSGWRFVGWTPVKGFDPAAPDPFLFRMGDRIRFCPTQPDEARDLQARQAAGHPIVEVETLGPGS